jgi:hypothetical protein
MPYWELVPHEIAVPPVKRFLLVGVFLDMEREWSERGSWLARRFKRAGPAENPRYYRKQVRRLLPERDDADVKTAAPGPSALGV